jgi:PHP family Zn ribbon phosphoesterase
MNKTHGLRFKKFDLHIHTPASHCHEEKNITAKDIVDEAISKGLSGIAITDHNTGEFIDAVKEAAKDTKLVVFPGVEISASGGKSGIHVVGLLDVQKGTKEITSLLGALSIDPATYGKKDAISRMSVYDVIQIITSPPFNGIAILAHCTSTKGVLNELSGEARKKIFSHPFLLAVETSDYDFTNDEKIEKGKRAVDVLDGNDENYLCKKLGVFVASDSHTKGAIGSVYTFFKVDDKINLESLRQCFIDRDVRIRQHFEYKENKFPYISKIKITGGFFDGEEADFHSGLNSILGSKGSGKSLLVEFLRFGLNQPSTHDEIAKDYEGKLSSKLGMYGVIDVLCVDETGKEFTVRRTYDPTNDHPFEDEGESIPFIFPVLFLSQNEIIKIAENDKEQLNFIDMFFDFRHYKIKISNVKQELKELDRKFADSLKSYHEKIQLEKQLDIYKKEMDALNKRLSDAIYDRYKNVEKKDNTLKLQSTVLEELKKMTERFIDELQYWTTPQISEDIKTDPAVRRNTDSLTKAFKEVDSKLKDSSQFVERELYALSVEYKSWDPTFIKEKEAYEKHVRESGGDKAALEAQRKKISVQTESINKRLTVISEKALRLKSLKEQRDVKIQDLSAIYAEYTAARKDKCKKFETDSIGRLQIILHELSNRDEFRNRLLRLKKGSRLKDSDMDTIAHNISPNDFIWGVLRYDTNKKRDVLNDIARQTTLDIDKLTVLAEFLLSEFGYEELLELQYIAYPQDRPEIKYKIAESEYELLQNLSVGQKCTAMLIMALSEGTFPVVVDQPEDSLDVRTIWDDMCSKVRRGKEDRQFVFTTHNSSLAVASDTDKFTILESDARKGRVVYSGALENPDIHDEVINYLEGGRKTYFAKYSKYNFPSEKQSPED